MGNSKISVFFFIHFTLILSSHVLTHELPAESDCVFICSHGKCFCQPGTYVTIKGGEQHNFRTNYFPFPPPQDDDDELKEFVKETIN